MTDDKYSRRPTIDELEAILNREEDYPIVILPNGEVRSVSNEMLDKIMDEAKTFVRNITLPDGTVLPEPVREAPALGTTIYLAAVEESGYLPAWVWMGDKRDMYYMRSGIVHLSEENARAWFDYFTRLARGK